MQIKCAARLKEQNHDVHTYGDLGFHSLGNLGRQVRPTSKSSFYLSILSSSPAGYAELCGSKVRNYRSSWYDWTWTVLTRHNTPLRRVRQFGWVWAVRLRKAENEVALESASRPRQTFIESPSAPVSGKKGASRLRCCQSILCTIRKGGSLLQIASNWTTPLRLNYKCCTSLWVLHKTPGP